MFFIDSFIIINAVNWEQNKNSGAAPQLKGARWFSFDEMRKYTNNFAEANTIGSGGYGQVFINDITYLRFYSILCLLLYRKSFIDIVYARNINHKYFSKLFAFCLLRNLISHSHL